MLGTVLALLAGALMSIQGVWNAEVTRQTGIWLSSGWVQLSAFVLCFLMWILNEQTPVSALWQVEPKYVLAGGVLGALITYTVIRSISALGPARSALLIVVCQIAVSYLIEIFGLFGTEKAVFEWKKLLGALIAAAGIIIFHH